MKNEEFRNEALHSSFFILRSSFFICPALRLLEGALHLPPPIHNNSLVKSTDFYHESGSFMVHQERLEIGEKCFVTSVMAVLATEAALTVITNAMHFSW